MPPSPIAIRRARNTRASSDGTIALDGGWRVYSSGAGIALGLIAAALSGAHLEAARAAASIR